MDDDDVLTQCTQPSIDPRRMGRNNSGLPAEDVADVICILHPATPAAFRLVADTVVRPQHILQNSDLPRRTGPFDKAVVDDEVTFILNRATVDSQARDLALRFSSRTISPRLGFVFGRNPAMCDVVVRTDMHKRVSNVHFAIYFNETGVLMLRDLSTNGTMIDEVLLKGKTSHHPHSRMLTPGSVIQILSPTQDEILKFIVRFPSRDGYYDEYDAQFQDYMRRLNEDLLIWRRNEGLEDNEDSEHRSFSIIKAPVPHNQFGMHWNGGEKYNVVGHVGKGAFASVYQLATKLEGNLFAAKELEKRRFMKNGVLDRKLENEMTIMQSIDHPSVVAYHDYQHVANHLYIIMEFVPCGDLQQFLGEHGPLPEDMAKQMAMQVLDALDYLHKKNITHRDIKPDNILLASINPDNFIIKLSDFGLSKAVKNNDTFLKTFCGTLLYCAPEVFPHYDTHVIGKGVKRPRSQKGFRSYSHAVDIWSLGAVLWYSLCHKPPFEGVADNTGRGMFDKIMMTPLDAAQLAKQGVSDEAVALLVAMLNTDPASRPSAEDCLRFPWFASRKPIFPRRPQLGLGAIAEEASTDTVAGAEEFDVARLSLQECQFDDLTESQQVEVSLNSADMDFFDLRQSKRIKTAYENDGQGDDEDELLDSSAELGEMVPIAHREEANGQAHAQAQNKAASRPRAPKLFGEISHSDLQSPAFAGRTNNAVRHHGSSTESGAEPLLSRDQPQQAHDTTGRVAGDSPSLLGAESMVREMDIDSHFSRGSRDADGEETEPNSPQAPLSSGDTKSSDLSHKTPLANRHDAPHPSGQAENEPFSRRIDIPLPPSFFYEADDPSTHNVEYASKVSGHDFAKDPEFRLKDSALPPSAGATALSTKHGKSCDGSNASSQTDSQMPPNQSDHPAPEEVGDVPSVIEDDPSNPLPRLGRLIPTRDSVPHSTLDLNERITTYGRSSRCTYQTPDKSDLRVAKSAISVFFHASDIDNVPGGEEDWDRLSGLYCGIVTYSSNGLKVNGVPLHKSEPGKQAYGKLHTGDVVEVYAPTGSAPGLKFYVDLYKGSGMERRDNASSPFVLEKEKRRTSKTSQKEKE